jgi:alkanesulfonate monooxygenase SsuD/methylene tetrahydromethanopterin reductase-like flavin-dependent oxidoreductase (luciferase family)
MRISYNLLWQNWTEARPARQFVTEEMELLLLAENLGFDIILCPEHHFDQDYSACPDNFLPLTYVAARTERIELGLGAVIIPWNDPLRVVEKFSMLDHLSNGRCRIGFGRGLSKIEYELFGLEMSDSRDMFNEGYKIIMDGLRTGYVEGDGPFFKQRRTAVVPEPRAGLADVPMHIGMSPDSAVNAGRFGGELMMFMNHSVEASMPLIQGYYGAYTETTGEIPLPPTTVDFMFCHEDADTAAKDGALYAGRFYGSVVRHYSFDGDHFAKTKGYETYAAGAQVIRDEGMEASTQAFVDAQAGIGTPEQIVEKYRHRIEVMGPCNPACAFFYGGMSKETAERSTRLFASEVMPELRKLGDEATTKPQAEPVSNGGPSRSADAPPLGVSRRLSTDRAEA